MSDIDMSAIDNVAHHDERMARRLRANVAVIARRTGDPDLRALCLKVLGGQQSVRRVFEHPSFSGMLQHNLANLKQGLDRVPPERREEALRRIGEQITDDEVLDTLRDAD